jgi:hypothetical protein
LNTHLVRPGETLSALAIRFAVPLAAIARVNNKQNNVNLIRVGETLRIPLAKQRYDELIKNLEGLLAEAQRDHLEGLAEVGAIEKDSNRMGATVDLAADIATCFVGVGKALLKYGGVVRTAAVRKKLFEAAQKVVTFAVSDGGADQKTKIAIDSVGAANADQFVRATTNGGTIDSKQYAGSAAKSAVKGTTKAVSKHLIKSNIAVEKQLYAELLVGFAIQAAFTGFKKATDVAGAIGPSQIAQGWIGWREGEDPRTTFDRSRKTITASFERTKAMLTERIAALRKERAAAYG